MGRPKEVPFWDCARPPFALQRRRELGPERFIYDNPEADPGAGAALIRTPLELLDRIAALVPPPRIHRNRYCGLLAPNAPRRAAGTAVAVSAATAPAATAPNAAAPAAEPAHRRAARFAWALLLN